MKVYAAEAKERQREHGRTAPGKTSLTGKVSVSDRHKGEAASHAAKAAKSNPKYVAVAKKFFLAALFLAPTCRGQTINIVAGHDGLLDTNGGYVEMWMPDEWNILFGYGDNGLGFAARRKLSAGTLVIGDKIVTFTSPGLGLAVPLRGGSFQMKNGLTLFAGATGNSFTEPFFETQNRFTSFGAGFTYHHDWKSGFTVAASALTAKHKSTAVGSLSEKQRHWTAYLSGGLLEGQRTLDLGATCSLWILNASASRSTLIANALTTSFDSASLGARLGSAYLGASRYQSQTTSGDSFFGNWRATDDVTVRANYLTAPGQKIMDLGILERIGERITISPGATRSNGAWAWTMGGSFRSNLAMFNVSYERMFLPFAVKNPWQKTLLVSVALQLPHNARATVRSFLTPQGKLKWVVYAEQYLSGPLGETSASSATLTPHFEKYVISGIVLDENGLPVFGAALHIGKALLSTDSAGAFEIRVKNKSYAVTMNADEFTSPGRWRIVSCPASASAGEHIRIVVSKL